MGTQQSGVLDLLIADLGKDGQLLQHARTVASKIIDEDPELTTPENQVIKAQIESMRKSTINWSRIS
jgi:ATP-dependent DNA helicase RecG